MPNETKCGKKRESSETAEVDAKKICVDVISFFKKQETMKLSIEKAELREYVERNEQLQLEISYKEEAFKNMKKYLADKSKELDEIDEQYNNLFENFDKLNENFVEINIKYADLEVSYDKDRMSLTSQIKNLNEQITSMDTALCAKEAECAACLMDMRTKLEDADLKNVQFEQKLSELKSKILELENLLDTNNEQAAAEKQNLLELYEVDTTKLQEKIDEKSKRVESLEMRLKDMETENRELNDSLKIQQNKIHQLQCVLNRPCTRPSPSRETAENEDRPTAQVEPTVELTETSSSSSRPATPELNTQINQQQNVDRAIITNSPPIVNNNVNEMFQNQPQEVVNISAPIQVEQNIMSNVEVSVQNMREEMVSMLSHEDETSDDLLFPSYFPRQRNR